jgi:hypothetical protein
MHFRSPHTLKTPARSKRNQGKGTTRFGLIRDLASPYTEEIDPPPHASAPESPW